MADTNITIDDLTPPEIAQKAVAVGIKKAGLDFWSAFFLAVLAGAFIAFGGIMATTIGNIIGGCIFIGVTYWFIYLRNNK